MGTYVLKGTNVIRGNACKRNKTVGTIDASRRKTALSQVFLYTRNRQAKREERLKSQAPQRHGEKKGGPIANNDARASQPQSKSHRILSLDLPRHNLQVPERVVAAAGVEGVTARSCGSSTTTF